MIATAKIVMQTGAIILAFVGIYFYVAKRSELILSKKIKYSPDREMILGRLISILFLVLVALFIWVLEILIK